VRAYRDGTRWTAKARERCKMPLRLACERMRRARGMCDLGVSGDVCSVDGAVRWQPGYVARWKGAALPDELSGLAMRIRGPMSVRTISTRCCVGATHGYISVSLASPPEQCTQTLPRRPRDPQWRRRRRKERAQVPQSL
jgi:hypothetical protein